MTSVSPKILAHYYVFFSRRCCQFIYGVTKSSTMTGLLLCFVNVQVRKWRHLSGIFSNSDLSRKTTLNHQLTRMLHCSVLFFFCKAVNYLHPLFSVFIQKSKVAPSNLNNCSCCAVSTYGSFSHVQMQVLYFGHTLKQRL